MSLNRTQRKRISKLLEEIAEVARINGDNKKLSIEQRVGWLKVALKMSEAKRALLDIV